jgi:putative membrane protein
MKETLMYFDLHYWGMHMFWWIFWLVLIVLIMLAGAWFWRGRPPRDSALEILRRRYAAGEITEEEYRTRLEGLRSGPPDARAQV